MCGNTLDVCGTVSLILAGRYVMFRNKPMHPGWMRSQQIRTLDAICRGGSVKEALFDARMGAME
jgi:hypothetical protein